MPRGPHGLERDVVLFSQRARLMEGVVLAVAEKGYAATRVEDITRRAKVSRTTFYEQFAGKEECFVAAYEAGAEAHIHHIEAAARRTSGWPQVALEAVRAHLEVMRDAPPYTRAFLIEVHAAGPAALAARMAAHQRYAELLMSLQAQAREEVEDIPELPQEIFMAAVAAADEVIVDHVGRGEYADLLELVPIIAYIHLALVGVPSLAREALAVDEQARTKWLPITRRKPAKGAEPAA